MQSIRAISPWLVTAILLSLTALAVAIWNSHMTGVPIVEYLSPTVLLILAVFISISIAKQIQKMREHKH